MIKLIKRLYFKYKFRNHPPTLSWSVFAMDDRVNLRRKVDEELRKRSFGIS